MLHSHPAVDVSVSDFGVVCRMRASCKPEPDPIRLEQVPVAPLKTLRARAPHNVESPTLFLFAAGTCCSKNPPGRIVRAEDRGSELRRLRRFFEQDLPYLSLL